MAVEVSNEPQAFQRFEHDGWETVSEGYDRWVSQLTNQSVQDTLDCAAVADGMRVLDVCTGPGMLAAAALERGAYVTGLDFSERVLEVARRNVPAVEFQKGDAQALPFPPDSFDAVVCGFGIIHVPRPDKALSEMLRVLKPGGRVAVSVWEAPKPTNGWGLLFGAIKANGDLDVPLPHGPDIFQFSDEKNLTAALDETGFKDIEIRQVEQTWELNDPLGIVTAILEGAVRARALLEAQTDTARDAIFNAVKSDIDQYASADGFYRVPMPALVGAGTK